ncbi:hypothetical protein, partial [Mycobacterium tuberculosis]|uniref:hypothetical protein n=1 Tax=Mycobacterium tuberculosis TaxID=1773 RepID=UPI001AE4A5DB
QVEPGWARPLAVAPGRGDLAAVLPVAPTRPAEPERRAWPRGPEAGTAWRGDGQAPTRGDNNNPRVFDARPAVVQQPQLPV